MSLNIKNIYCGISIIIASLIAVVFVTTSQALILSLIYCFLCTPQLMLKTEADKTPAFHLVDRASIRIGLRGDLKIEMSSEDFEIQCNNQDVTIATKIYFETKLCYFVAVDYFCV